MDYTIDWTNSALEDLSGIVSYIARDNPTAAKKFGTLIIRKVESISDFPHIGRIVPEFRNEQTRELILRPYRLIYQISEKHSSITVLRIWHSARSDLDL